jgi:hypothetical protein
MCHRLALLTFAILAATLLARPLAAAPEPPPGVESADVLVDRLLALPGYLPDPRKPADDQRTRLMQAIFARGQAGADAMVARLLSLSVGAADSQGAPNASIRMQLARDIGTLGDVAVEPLQKGLAQAKTADQRRDMVQALGSLPRPAATRAMIPLLSEQDDTVRQMAFSLLSDRLGVPAEQGGGDDILPAMAKTLPGEKSDFWRMFVCGRVVRVLMPIPPDARQLAQATDLLRERLQNDPSAPVRCRAACSLTEFGDYSGLAELEKGALALQADGRLAKQPDSGQLIATYSLDRLVPALERATGQKFGPLPLNPDLASDLRAIPELIRQRQELLDKMVAWIKAHPAPAVAPNQGQGG